ncbi:MULTISPECIES: DUF3168 domain-containing protein [unclassified Sphingomonas]|uniref:tail completion protein gp17 n=1 Tax=unclassified Sphingomonas TaxID=196159 RepID=UPI00226A2F55|nr:MULTISPECIES: DUF3168 domain-containing protein [unclassified Sphingomonas]
MSARILLQAAVVAALKPALPGARVFDAPPVRGGVPYAVVDEPVLADWSTKSWSGFEGRVVVALTDAGERPVRLRQLVSTAEDAACATRPEIGEGWRIVQFRLVKSRIARSGADRWGAASEFLVRLYRLS